MATHVDALGKRQRSFKRKLLYAAIPTIVALLVVEGLFRLYVAVHDKNAIQRRFEELSRRPAYASKPWFSRDFIASLRAEGTGFYTPSGTRLVFPVDYADQHFTIKDGTRGTKGFDRRALLPGHRQRRLFLFGGSTTYCEEVPDAFTYASQLQEKLAASPATRDIEVVNCGIPAVVSLEEVQRLEYEIGRNNIPDYCIFFNGINDANQGVVNGHPGHTIRETAETYRDQGLLSTLRQIARVSVAARTIRQSIMGSQRKNEPVPRSSARCASWRWRSPTSTSGTCVAPRKSAIGTASG